MKVKKITSGLLIAGTFIFAAVTLNAQAKNQNTGTKAGTGQRGAFFVDANGDGICDNFNTTTGIRNGSGRKYGAGRGFGMNNGGGYGVCNGTGKGAGGRYGTGVCDGTGPKGRRGR